jgi:hypothetical protein
LFLQQFKMLYSRLIVRVVEHNFCCSCHLWC